MLSHLRVRRFYFPGLAYSPARENKNVTFSLSARATCMRSSSNLTSHVLVVLQRFLYYWAPWATAAIKSFARNPRLECLGHVITLLGPLPSIMGYDVSALGTFNPALRSARSDGTCLALERKAWRWPFYSCRCGVSLGVREAIELVWLWNGKRGGCLSLAVAVASHHCKATQAKKERWARFTQAWLLVQWNSSP